MQRGGALANAGRRQACAGCIVVVLTPQAVLHCSSTAHRLRTALPRGCTRTRCKAPGWG
jgi:hypothetical protein